jgi:5-methylcytosine-specific restriction endonuclease McrA
MANQQWKSRYSNGNARRKLRARVKAEGRVCGICGRPIDYSLPAGDPWCYELDEIVPFALGGSPYDYDNVQPAHRICNQRKGKKMLKRKAQQEIKSDDCKADKAGTSKQVNKSVAVSQW